VFEHVFRGVGVECGLEVGDHGEEEWLARGWQILGRAGNVARRQRQIIQRLVATWRLTHACVDGLPALQANRVAIDAKGAQTHIYAQ